MILLRPETEMDSLIKGVQLPPSSLPPYIFRVLNQHPPLDLVPKTTCCGFECWYESGCQGKDNSLGPKIPSDKEQGSEKCGTLLVSNVPKKKTEEEGKEKALKYYAQLVTYVIFTGTLP